MTGVLMRTCSSPLQDDVHAELLDPPVGACQVAIEDVRSAGAAAQVRLGLAGERVDPAYDDPRSPCLERGHDSPLLRRQGLERGTLVEDALTADEHVEQQVID